MEASTLRQYLINIMKEVDREIYGVTKPVIIERDQRVASKIVEYLILTGII